jgi:hypothetical protein
MAKATKYELERQLAQAEQSLDTERARGAVLVGRVAELEAMVRALQSSTEAILRLTSAATQVASTPYVPVVMPCSRGRGICLCPACLYPITATPFWQRPPPQPGIQQPFPYIGDAPGWGRDFTITCADRPKPLVSATFENVHTSLSVH